MPDREKVIKDLEFCVNGHFKVELSLATKILALLKEQEAVKPRVSNVEQRCGNCNEVIEMDGWITCPWCGKHIDWNGWWKKNGTRNQDS